ncbi:MAG: hypothetical protein ACLGGX_01055 [Bdellovibrionia bacterium]
MLNLKNMAQGVGRAIVLIVIATTMMGNESCQQQPQPDSGRKLRKIVEMGRITSSPLMLPKGGAFDFEFVANQQVYGVLAAHDGFTLRYTPPIASSPLTARGDEFLGLNKTDRTAFKAFAKSAGKDDFRVHYSKEAWCMVNLPQTRIAGSVNSFELIGGGGLTIGFTKSGQHDLSNIPEIGFNVEFAQLGVSMVATRPLTNKVMAATNVNSNQTKTQISMAFNAGNFRLGPSAYYQTPLATVTKKGLEKAITGLDEQLQSEEWFTRVLANHETHLVVVGGQDVRLEVGDELIIYNEDYYWDGEPCNSQYRGGGAAADAAVAKIRLDWVGDEISRGIIIEETDEAPVIGAKVKLFKFAPAKTDNGGGTVKPPSTSRPVGGN